MNYSILTREGKLRTVIFLAAAVLLMLAGIYCIVSFRNCQLENVLNDPPRNIDEKNFGFTLFFVKGMDLFNGFIMTILLCGYAAFMLVASVAVSLLMRFAVLRNTWDIQHEEFSICTKVYAATAIAGIVISLLITRGNMVVTTMIYEVIPVLFMTVLYILPLQKRSVIAGHGHFVQGTQQDLTNL